MFIPLMFGDPKCDTNTNVSTVADTYEDVTNQTGKGFLGTIIVNGAGTGNPTKCWLKITIDAGTACEIDCGSVFPGYNNTSDTNVIPIFIPFKTSIKVEGKNDTDTNAISVSTIYTLS